jgi:hypothetical protein
MADSQAATGTTLNPGATPRQKWLGAARQPRRAQAADGVGQCVYKHQITIYLIAAYTHIY